MKLMLLDKKTNEISFFSQEQKINSRGIVYRPDFLLSLPNTLKEQESALLQSYSLDGGNDFSIDRIDYESNIKATRRALIEKFADLSNNEFSALDIGCGPKGLSTLYLPRDIITKQDILDISFENIRNIEYLAKTLNWGVFQGDMHTVKLEKYNLVNLMSALDGTRFLYEALLNIKTFLHPNGICIITQDVFGGYLTTLGLEIDYRQELDLISRIPHKNYLNPLSCLFGENNELYWIVSEDRKTRKTSYDFLQDMQKKAAIEAGFEILFKGIAMAEDIKPCNKESSYNLKEKYFIERKVFDASLPNETLITRFYEDVLILKNKT